MNLHQTEAYMKTGLSDKRFDAYFVTVGVGGKTAFLASPHADKDTFLTQPAWERCLSPPR